MPKAKNHLENRAPSSQQATEKLIEVLHPLAEQVEALVQQVRTLTDRAQVLTEAIDDVRAELEISCSYYLHFFQSMTTPTYA